MHIEAALIDRLGDVGRKLHTARSRNDQVATDVEALDPRRASTGSTAGCSTCSGPCRLRRAASRRDPPGLHPHAACPAGAGRALCPRLRREARPRPRPRSPTADAASTSCPWARRPWPGRPCRSTASTSPRSSASTASPPTASTSRSDRDFALETVFDLALIAEHLSGWAEEWVLWSTQEFGFLALPDAVCTGSSIMPQKKNPDVCELIRGRSARVVGVADDPARADQGAAPGLQPRPPGRQGAPLRRLRHRRSLPRTGRRRRRRGEPPDRRDRRHAWKRASSTRRP